MYISNFLNHLELSKQNTLDFWQNLIDSMDIPIFFKDIGGIYLLCNKSFEEFTGTTKNNIIGKICFEIFTKDLATKIYEKDQQILTNPDKQSLISSNISKDNKEYKINVNLTTFSNDKGIVGIIYDITKLQRQTEVLKMNHEELYAPSNNFRITEEKYLKLFHNCTTPCSITNAVTGKIIKANNAFKSLLNYDQIEVVGLTTKDLGIWVHPEQRDFVLSKISEEESISNYECLMKSKDGKIKTVLFSGTKIFLDGEYFITTQVVDITELKMQTEELQKANDELNDLYNNAPCGYHSVDKDGIFLRINDTELKWLGYSREEVVGKIKAFDLFTENTKHTFKSDLEKLIRYGEISNAEKEFIRKDGTILPVLVNATVIKDKHGHFIMSRSTVFDNTKQKIIEEEINDKNKQLSILNKISDLFLLYDDDEMFEKVLEVVLLLFKCKYGVFGYIDEQENLVCPSMAKTIYLECQIEHKTIIFPRVAWGGIWGRALIEKKILFSNIKSKVPNGHIPIFKSLVVPIVFNDNSIGLLHIANKETDFDEKDLHLLKIISEHISPVLKARLDRNLQAKKAKISDLGFKYNRSLIEASLDPFFVLTKDGIISDVNHASEMATGFSREELIGTDLLNYLTEPEKVKAEYLESLNSDIPNEYFVELKHKDGYLTPIMYNSSVFQIANSELRIFVSARDLTSIKLVEEKYLLANKELEAFSYSVSHDLRAPLRSIDGFSTVLIEDYSDKLDALGKNYLGRIKNASKKMSQLIDDLLNLSRISQTQVVFKEFDLSKIVKELLYNLQKLQPEIKVEFIIKPDIKVRGDKKLLNIAIENLINNAWKFTSKCSCRKIEFGTVMNNDKCEYFIKDNGIGFDMAYINMLFTPFQRLNGSEEYSGTGIGLVTVQRIIHKHSGYIRAEGEVGKGAKFCFTLS